MNRAWASAVVAFLLLCAPARAQETFPDLAGSWWVEPTEIAFADTPVGSSKLETVTVTNTGDGLLTGDATLPGVAFELLELGSIIPERSLHYTSSVPARSRSR